MKANIKEFSCRLIMRRVYEYPESMSLGEYHTVIIKVPIDMNRMSTKGLEIIGGEWLTETEKKQNAE